MVGKAIKLYTSYFGNAKKLRAAGCAIISIARYNPKFIRDLNGWCVSIAPTAEMLSMAQEDYDREMKAILAKADAARFYAEFTKRAGRYDSVALCCYEKNINECHRKLVGEWLTAAGFKCAEFGVSRPVGPVTTQMELI